MASTSGLYSPIKDYPIVVNVDGKDVAVSHKCLPRDEERMVVEIEVTPSNGIGVCEQHVKPGKQLLALYKSQFPALRDRVASKEDQARWAEAGKSYEKRLEAFLSKECGAPTAYNQNDPQYLEARKRASLTYAETSQAQLYFDAHSAGCPPIASLRVVLESAAPPETPERKDRNAIDAIVTKLGDVLADALASKGKPEKRTAA
jgi:hypothetical protein